MRNEDEHWFQLYAISCPPQLIAQSLDHDQHHRDDESRPHRFRLHHDPHHPRHLLLRYCYPRLRQLHHDVICVSSIDGRSTCMHALVRGSCA